MWPAPAMVQSCTAAPLAQAFWLHCKPPAPVVVVTAAAQESRACQLAMVSGTLWRCTASRPVPTPPSKRTQVSARPWMCRTGTGWVMSQA